MADAPPDDAELAHLLTRLLGMLSPGLRAGDDAPPAAGGQPASGSQPPAAPTPAVSPAEARALIELAGARGIAQGELARVLGLDKSTVSRLAASLERKGWIRRGRDEANQRYLRLQLTPAGQAAADRAWQVFQSRQARLWAALTEDERSGLAAGLRGLIRGLSAGRAAPDHSPRPAR